MPPAKIDVEISCHNLWKIFGPHPQRVLENLNRAHSRADVLETTGHVVGVKDVSFEVRRGETFVVMGLSGSGKSTLIRCISRLIEPTAGQVIVEGEEMIGMDDNRLRQLRLHKFSMVFQHFGLFPHRKVIDNVAYGLEVQGLDKEKRYARAREVLQLVSLQGWENHYPGQLSGGMQQRVGIARALAVDPQILFFDEPFSALDPLIRREMQDELIHLQEMMRKTIVFITHDFLEAVKLGDYIAIMKDGEIVQTGRPDQIILHPVNDYVQAFTKDVPRSRVLSAKAVMRACRVVLSTEESLTAARSHLQAQAGRNIFITNAQGQFMGLVSLAELEAAAHQNGQTVGSLVGDQQPTVRPDTILGDLISLVATSDVPVPVVDETRQLLGAVNRTDVMLALSGLSEAR